MSLCLWEPRTYIVIYRTGSCKGCQSMARFNNRHDLTVMEHKPVSTQMTDTSDTNDDLNVGSSGMAIHCTFLLYSLRLCSTRFYIFPIDPLSSCTLFRQLHLPPFDLIMTVLLQVREMVAQHTPKCLRQDLSWTSVVNFRQCYIFSSVIVVSPTL